MVKLWTVRRGMVVYLRNIVNAPYLFIALRMPS